jgi:uncharacterized protein (DUF1499 family)
MSEAIERAPADLEPCRNRPNCVSSQAAGSKQFVEPFEYTNESDLQTLHDLLAEMSGCRIVITTETYLRAEFRSRILGLVDDLELLVDNEQKVIQVRSASRLGFFDLGVNRNRVESLRSLYLSA